MTFKEILDLTKNRINELDDDEQIDIILKEAINQAYRSEIGKIDKRVTSATVPIVKGIATLPEDIDNIEEIEPPLSPLDRRIGNIILSKNTGSFRVIYSYIREKLVNEEDELDLSPKFDFLLSTYAAYIYFKHRKKLDVANSYFSEYAEALSRLDSRDNVVYTMENYYGSFMGDDF